MNKRLSCILFAVILCACAPSQDAIQATIQAGIQATQNAQPTATRLPTETPAPTATADPTITASPSPTPDVRLIDINPKELLLQKADLPAEARYYLPDEAWISPVRNSEIVSEWTVEEGQAYLAATGRIDGWLIYYKRGASGAVLPEQIFNNVVIYSTIEGAQLYIAKYSDRRITEENYTEIDVPEIGDTARAFMKRETNSGGETRVWIYVSFSYRNVSHTVNIYGWEKEITLDFAASVANKLLEGLKQLPLSDTVTFKP
jgi:hypothetical protein